MFAQIKRINRRLKQNADTFRHSLSYIEALPQLALLGLIVGLFTAGVIALFRFTVDICLSILLPEHNDNFEALSSTEISGLIASGAAVIYLILRLAGPSGRSVGVSHVLLHVHQFQGVMPARNWFTQFFGAAVAMISGQSVGREGPTVHLGAGAASLFGAWLKLPHNSLNTLVGCGVAAAISASFNTPMAGVIFAMEVILMEYSVVGFAPVILASVTSAAVTRTLFPEAGLVVSSDATLSSMLELPLLFAFGLVIAIFAGLFIKLHLRVVALQNLPLSLRIGLAALINIAASIVVPQTMGLGYDTLNAAMTEQLAIGTLLLICIVKLSTAGIGIGLGIPGGLIGPSLLSGACLGGAVGAIANIVFPGLGLQPSFYVMLGMAGMMGAAINAPLAALVAVLELTYNSHVIFPSMLVIVVACICTRWLFGYEGIFHEQLKAKGQSIVVEPTRKSLQRLGVRSAMVSAFECCPVELDYESARELLKSSPTWLVVEQDKSRTAIRAANLATWLENNPESALKLEEKIDLFAIPADRIKLSAISENASLWEASTALKTQDVEALWVMKSYSSAIAGILTQEELKNVYVN